MRELKKNAIRGGIFRLCGQVINIALRLGSTIVLARLLEPKDFGLVAMVTAVTGAYELFTSAGLSMATVQRSSISSEQISTLFWINALMGLSLVALCLGTAPLLVAAYGEPRLFWITAAMGAGFFFTCAGVQHVAIMHRHLQYGALSIIEIAALAGGIGFGIALALADAGYWALVGMAIVPPVITTTCVWLYLGWVPGAPAWQPGTLDLLKFGGTITMNTLIVHIAFNLEKVLLGRYWGPEVLGLYGRAYALINFGSGSLHSAIGPVVFSALSRTQDDPVRNRAYFLKAYALVNSVTIPSTLFCALFAEDLIAVLLGPKWHAAAQIFRFLAPTILVFGLITPFAWWMQSCGYQNRSLAMAIVIALLAIAAYVAGLPYGATGVAMAYSIAMLLWAIPHIMWSVHGTAISTSDVLFAISRPAVSSLVAGAISVAVVYFFRSVEIPIVRLAIGGAAMAVSYVIMLVLFLGQKSLYTEIVVGLRSSSSSGAVG
jgi:PST family polysaccharide transporter